MDVEQLKTKSLCFECVGESFLRDEMRRAGHRLTCSYCGRTSESYSIGALADGSKKSSPCTSYARPTDRIPGNRRCFPIDSRITTGSALGIRWSTIATSAEMPEAAADDIQAVLEHQNSDFDADAIGRETEFASDSFYEERRTIWPRFSCSVDDTQRSFDSDGGKQLSASTLRH